MLDAARAEVDPERRMRHYQGRAAADRRGGRHFDPDVRRSLGRHLQEVLNYHEHGFEFDYLNIGLR